MAETTNGGMRSADIGHHPSKDAGAVSVNHSHRRGPAGEGLVEESLQVVSGTFAVETDEVELPRGFVGTWEVLQPTLKRFVIHETDA